MPRRGLSASAELADAAQPPRARARLQMCCSPHRGSE